VSYPSKDKTIADAVVSGLEIGGIRCWIAPRDLTPGMNWPESITNAIDSSRIMLIIFSGNSNHSSNVLREVEFAISKGLHVIPFRIEKTDPSGSLAYFLSTTHWIDGFPPPIERYIDKLVETIRVYIGSKTVSTDQDHTDSKIINSQKDTVEKRSFIKRIFNRAGNDNQEEKTTADYLRATGGNDENTRLKVVDSLEVQGASTQGVIQFCIGDVTRAGQEHLVDVLVASAYRDSYYPVPGSVFGSLFRKGISVEDLANNKEVDLRGAFSCWLSKEIIDPPEGIRFRRLLCYEPSESAKAGEQIGDIFRSLAPFIGGQEPIRTVATTLVAAGASRRITQHQSLQLLVEAAVHWMSAGLPIECFKIICLPNQDDEALTQLFSDLKSRYKSAFTMGQYQFSYDFFFSYSHKDTREIDLFMDMLLGQNKDLRIYIDKKHLNLGSAWQREIYEAIDDCHKVAIFYSPTYLDSKVCIEEFNIALCRHRESDEPILKPIYLYSANLPTYMRLVQFFDCRESNQDKLQQAANHLLQDVL